MSNDIVNNITPHQDPLGNLDFSGMIPEAMFSIVMILFIVLSVLGMGLAFRARDGKKATAIAIIVLCIIVLSIIGIKYILPEIIASMI